MLSAAKPKLNPVILFFAKPFKDVNPNILTLLGLIPPIIFIWLMLGGHYIWALISFVGIFFDTLDGAVARMSGKVTAFGGLLDSTLDRLADAIYIIAFVVTGLVNVPLGFALIVVSFLVSYIRSRAELAGKGEFLLAVGLIERSERLVCVFIALVVARFVPGLSLFGLKPAELVFSLLLILSIFTVGQRLILAGKLLKDK